MNTIMLSQILTAVFVVLCVVSAAVHLGAFFGDIMNRWRVAPMMSPVPRKLIRAGMVASGGASIFFIVMIAMDRWVQIGLPEIVAQLGIALYGGGSFWGAMQRGMAIDPEPERSQTRRDNKVWSPSPTPRPQPAADDYRYRQYH